MPLQVVRPRICSPVRWGSLDTGDPIIQHTMHVIDQGTGHRFAHVCPGSPGP